MRIKHAGQMPLPINPLHGAGQYHAQQAKRAIAALSSDSGGPALLIVQTRPIPTTVKRRRVVAKEGRA